MLPSSSRDFVEAVRGAGDIVRLISDYVPLKQAGARYKGLCPFHEEKTPSFSVDPSQQLFYCFGCQAGGDAFKFVMLYEKVDFREALELLAVRWGVPVPAASRGPEGDQRRRLMEINQAAGEFFERMLRDADSGRRAREYLARRGVSDEVATRSGIGYAPDRWDALLAWLRGRRFGPEEIVTAGLAVPRQKGTGEYDRFRDRLMFPVRDASGRIVAFGGRALGEAEPKYINSPETPVYVKGSHLYGLDVAKEAIRREGFAIVVEGYLDVAALRQTGFDHAVASLGTAFTAEQARLLARFTQRVAVCYDGDSAGAAATVRSLDLLLESGFEVRVVELPSGMDPDDYIRREGAEAYGRCLQEAPGYLEFLLLRQIRSRDISRGAEKAAAVNALLPHLARLASPIERATWAGRLADALQIDDALVLQELKAALRARKSALRQRPAAARVPREAEARLVRLLLGGDEEACRRIAELDPEDLEGTRVAAIVKTILRKRSEDGGAEFPAVFQALESEDDRNLLTYIAARNEPESAPGDSEGCFLVLRRDRLIRERLMLQKEIEKTPDPTSVDALLLRKQQLGRQIDALS